MLKAVRFDDNEHKELLNFITNYIDTRGKRNESEAIRYLMSKGLESINNPIQPQQSIDVDKIKAELFQQVMMSIGSISPAKHVESINYDSGESIGVLNKNAIAKFEIKEEIKKLDNEEEQPSKPATSSNPLIANMLANRKR